MASGAIIWNIDEDGNKAKDFLLTGNSSIVKSVECAIFIGNLLDDDIAVSNFIEIKNSIAIQSRTLLSIQVVSVEHLNTIES